MHILAVAARRQMHPHALGTPNGDHRISDFKHEPGTVFNRPTVLIGAMIGTVLKKLIDQVAIGSVDLHAIKTSDLRVLRAFAESLDDARNL
jgi:hypothetical protein